MSNPTPLYIKVTDYLNSFHLAETYIFPRFFGLHEQYYNRSGKLRVSRMKEHSHLVKCMVHTYLWLDPTCLCPPPYIHLHVIKHMASMHMPQTYCVVWP